MNTDDPDDVGGPGDPELDPNPAPGSSEPFLIELFGRAIVDGDMRGDVLLGQEEDGGEPVDETDRHDGDQPGA